MGARTQGKPEFTQWGNGRDPCRTKWAEGKDLTYFWAEKGLEREQLEQKRRAAGKDGNLHWSPAAFTSTHPRTAVDHYPGLAVTRTPWESSRSRYVLFEMCSRIGNGTLRLLSDPYKRGTRTHTGLGEDCVFTSQVGSWEGLLKQELFSKEKGNPPSSRILTGRVPSPQGGDSQLLEARVIHKL